MSSSEGRTPDFREPGSAPRWRVAVGAAVVVAAVLAGIVVAVSAVTSGREAVADVPAPVSSFSTPVPSFSTAAAPGQVFVHILGRVERPGLYEVPAGSRAVDVVARAGGFRGDADLAALNLARTVADGEQIVVPKAGESAVPVPPAGASSSSSSSSAPDMVDLNSADAATLETLSGVGPATSAAILAWREEHGRFAAVEDLLDVPGIGEKKLEALRESVVAG